MYKHHFGLTHLPLGKDSPNLWQDSSLDDFKTKFLNLVQSPGIGVLTGEPGVGKTAAIRHIVQTLNPHQYQVFYLPESHFTSFDIYRQMAHNLGLVPAHRYSQLWRDIKNLIKDSVDHKRCKPIFIIDEAQSLPHDFLRDFPSFLNFEFDARDMLTVWFVGHPSLTNVLSRNAYASLASRIQVRHTFQPILERERFTLLIEHAFKTAGCQTKLVSESGIEMIRIASQGRPRHAHLILIISMQLAAQRNLNHIPDDILQEAITQLKG
jgi:type II secretory pathway predicted ATPase ExeA